MAKYDLKEALVRGEVVRVIGERPIGWQGLGQSLPSPAFLVLYPDGEVGAVPEDELRPVP